MRAGLIDCERRPVGHAVERARNVAGEDKAGSIGHASLDRPAVERQQAERSRSVEVEAGVVICTGDMNVSAGIGQIAQTGRADIVAEIDARVGADGDRAEIDPIFRIRDLQRRVGLDVNDARRGRYKVRSVDVDARAIGDIDQSAVGEVYRVDKEEIVVRLGVDRALIGKAPSNGGGGPLGAVFVDDAVIYEKAVGYDVLVYVVEIYGRIGRERKRARVIRLRKFVVGGVVEAEVDGRVAEGLRFVEIDGAVGSADVDRARPGAGGAHGLGSVHEVQHRGGLIQGERSLVRDIIQSAVRVAREHEPRGVRLASPDRPALKREGAERRRAIERVASVVVDAVDVDAAAGIRKVAQTCGRQIVAEIQACVGADGDGAEIDPIVGVCDLYA